MVLPHLTDFAWVYRRADWNGHGLAALTCDEWGRRTVAVALPGGRVLVVAYARCRHPACAARRSG